jgi:hypothetical protein
MEILFSIPIKRHGQTYLRTGVLMRTWRDAYNQLREDVPKEELRKLIEDVESAIFKRTTELRDIDDSNGEFKEMVEAMRTVRRLQIEKLNYPEFLRSLEQDI